MSRISHRFSVSSLQVSPTQLSLASALLLTAAACGSDAPDTTVPLDTTDPFGATTAPSTGTTPNATDPSVIQPQPVDPALPPVAPDASQTATPPVTPVPTGTADSTPTVAPPANTTPPVQSSTEPSDTSGPATEPNTSEPNSSDTGAPPTQGVGFYTQDGKLLDVNGNEFLMRGVNYPYAWYKDDQDTQQMFQDIAAAGANTVRVVMATSQRVEGQGQRWPLTTAAEVRNIISWAKANKLVAMLELHDSTGYDAGLGPSSDQIPHPDHVLEYWLSNDVLTALEGQEAYVLVNIANEPFGNEASDQWQSFHAMAVAELRAGGLKHTLVVDAPFWGQDWTNCMRDGQTDPQRTELRFSCDAAAVYQADPDRNTMFSTHMYHEYGSRDRVRAYFERFLSKRLPFLIGEFAADHGSSGNVDEASIMELSAQHGIGYLGWSWSGNSRGLESLDITNTFTPTSLTTWGDRLINGEDGLKQTGVTCTCFD